MDRGLVSREQAAKFLACSIETVKRLQRSGKLQPVALAERLVRYRLADVEALANPRAGKK